MKVDMKHWNFPCHPLGVKWPFSNIFVSSTQRERPEHISNNVHNMYLYNYTRILLTHTHIMSAYRIHIYIYILSLDIKYVYYISYEIQQIYQNIRSSSLHLLYFSFDGQFFKNRQAQPI